MSGSGTIYTEQSVLGHTLGFAPMPFPAQVYVGLDYAAVPPSETAGGVEVTGGGYTRMPAQFALIDTPANIAANVATVEWPIAAASWGTLGFFEVWSAASGGNRLYWGPLIDTATQLPTTITVSGGDIVRFSAGTLAVQAATGAGGTGSVGAYLPLTGGQLSGPLLLSHDPTATSEAATKAYVDAHSGTGGGPGFLPISGGTMLGPIALAADPISAMQAATKQYTDALIAASGVSSFNTRTGAVALTSGDVTTALTYTPYDVANPAGYQTAAQVTTAVAPYAHNTGRNLLHNPLFNVAQRGVGPFTVGGYNLDRWVATIISDTSSFSQVALADADRTAIGDEAATVALQLVFTGSAAAGAITEIIQMTEGVRRLSGKTVTISFWAKAAAGAPKLGINMAQAFGTGGSPSASVNVLSTGNAVTLSTTWTRYTTTIAVPSSSGKVLGTNNNDCTWLQFFYTSGATNNAQAGNIGVQSGTIQLWGVQLEIGSAATPLDKRDPERELALCQRFYQNGNFFFYGYGLAASTPGYLMGYSATMRAGPTVSFNTTSSTNATASLSSYGAEEIAITANVVAAGNFGIQGTWIASADL